MLVRFEENCDFSCELFLDESENSWLSWECCNSPRAFSAAEAERGSRNSASSAEAGSLGAPVGSGRTSIHRDGSTTVVDVGTIAAVPCRVGGECAAVQRSRSIPDVQSAPVPCTISFQHTVHEGSDGDAAANVHSSSILQ